MVGDDADGDVVLCIGTVGLACDVLHMVQHTLDGIDLEQVADALHHAGQTLQAHAGINVGPCQALVMALAVGIELAEHQVPDLHIAVAVAAHAAGRLAAAVLRAAVEVITDGEPKVSEAPQQTESLTLAVEDYNKIGRASCRERVSSPV